MFHKMSWHGEAVQWEEATKSRANITKSDAEPNKRELNQWLNEDFRIYPQRELAQNLTLTLLGDEVSSEIICDLKDHPQEQNNPHEAPSDRDDSMPTFQDDSTDYPIDGDDSKRLSGII